MTQGDTPPQSEPQPAPRASPDMPPAPSPAAPSSATPGASAPPTGAAPAGPSTVGGFEFNNPTIISLLYLSACVLGVTGIVGVVLAYVWRNEAQAEWERSHYTYLIRTFWIWLIGLMVGAVLLIVLIGLMVWLAVGVLVIVRCVLSLVNAQKREPMPNPETWLA